MNFEEKMKENGIKKQGKWNKKQGKWNKKQGKCKKAADSIRLKTKKKAG